jgi:hypothetical protein
MGVGVARGATGATIAGNGGAGVVVGTAALVTREGGEEGGAVSTMATGLAGWTAVGDPGANADPLTSHGGSALAAGGDGTWDSDRGDCGDAVDGGVGGVNDRAMATKSGSWVSSFGGNGVGAGPVGARATICVTEIGSLIGPGTAGGAIGI